jgi:hypothetical protein
LRELRQQLEAAQTEARLLRGRLAAKEEEVARRDQEARLEKVSMAVGGHLAAKKEEIAR